MSKKYTGQKQDLEAIFTKEKNPTLYRKVAKYIASFIGATIIAGTIGINDLSQPDDPTKIQSVETIYDGAIKRLQITGISNKEYWSVEELKANKSKYKFSELKELEGNEYDEIVFINSAYKQKATNLLPIKAKKIKLVNSILLAHEIDADNIELTKNSFVESSQRKMLYIQTKNLSLYDSTIDIPNSGLINANNIFCKNSNIIFSNDSIIINATNLALDNSKIISDNNSIKFNVDDITLLNSSILSTHKDLVMDIDDMQLKGSTIESLNKSVFIKAKNNMALDQSEIKSESDSVVKSSNVINLDNKSIIHSSSGTTLVEAYLFEIFNSSHISGVNCIVKGEKALKEHIKMNYEEKGLGKLQLTNENGTFIYGKDEHTNSEINKKEHIK